ncbi:uncharacterized protein EDB93DRAFT_1253323 [Suillus bovinus]|uniref:uncharacterized protein n=1 Tax=Suillus bovinus TaxID=48563 RepID=UPI001B875F40|nr:uncharacterized protein EDB93DRAFT_1253323 [Suillus bovinus]KAG2138624.1 hypothetical protein EDB93DRAFT_1253323 [Suillus bovinus]
MSQQFNPSDAELSQYSEDMTAYTLEQLIQWRADLERKAKEQEEKERAAKKSQSNNTNSKS